VSLRGSEAYGQPASAQSWFTQTVAQGLLPSGHCFTHEAPGLGGQSAGTLHAWPPSGTTVPPPSVPPPLLLVPLVPLLPPLLLVPLLPPLLVPVPVLEELHATRSPTTIAMPNPALRMPRF
jgi:hypothetical protein